MRQIPTIALSATDGGGVQSLCNAFVPAQSWPLGKQVVIRGVYKMNIAAGTLPDMYNCGEGFSLTGALYTPLPVTGAFAPVTGTYATAFERRLIRRQDSIIAWDTGDVATHNWVNDYDAIEHVIDILPTSPPFDYYQQIEIGIAINPAGTSSLITWDCIYAEAFMESGVNLGRA